jgi:hypothetical protein
MLKSAAYPAGGLFSCPDAAHGIAYISWQPHRVGCCGQRVMLPPLPCMADGLQAGSRPSVGAGYRLPFVRWALLPGLLLMLSAGLMWLSEGGPAESQSAIVVVDSVELKSGGGDGFENVADIESAMGLEVEVLANRSGWTKIRTPSDQTGWTESDNLEVP